MNQSQRRDFLISELLKEEPRYAYLPRMEPRTLLRSLMNVRPPKEISKEFLEVQDAYLREAIREKGITRLSSLSPIDDGLYLWRGDITTLACDAIVNAANSGMTGCYQPCHSCIDNCIHTYAGVQLRQECADLMARQGHEEETGRAKITKAYNLPCKYVLHTVGPIVLGALTEEHERLLASCYRSCLTLAQAHGVESIAFCCISTGVFRFPNQRAAQIAVETVKAYRKQTGSEMKVIFNVFQQQDEAIYEKLLSRSDKTEAGPF